MLFESIIILTQPTPEFIEPKINSTSIVEELPTVRNEFRLAQATKLETSVKRTQTIEIPAGYILCPVNYVCIPKEQYNGQPVPPVTPTPAIGNNGNNRNVGVSSTVFNPNQGPSQNINQINQNVNPGISQINSQQNQYPGGYNPNQGISSPNGQPGGIGQQNIGIGSGGMYNGSNQPGRVFTDVNLGVNMRVSW